MYNLFPEIEPYNSFHLPVTDGHSLYVEECGNPQGQPALFLHGGPGGGTSANDRRFFDPKHYRIILFHQRGSGNSTPHASLENNTTWNLVDDIEKLRNHLEISKWLVFGGSWGSTLALTYAITHPAVVSALVLRGIFLCRPEDLKWFYQMGAHHIFPDAWKAYTEAIPQEQHEDFIAAYYKLLTSDNKEIQLKAAKAWSIWEGTTSKLVPDENYIAKFAADELAIAIARIECHYFMNNCFFDSKNWILENAHLLKNIPGIIVHGRYDIVCPIKQAFDLHQVWPEAKLEVIASAGHSSIEVGIVDGLVRATESFKQT